MAAVRALHSRTEEGDLRLAAWAAIHHRGTGRTPPSMARTLSLTVSSGHLTLGNLLGAIRHYLM
jgi:hypothetical protein